MTFFSGIVTFSYSFFGLGRLWDVLFPSVEQSSSRSRGNLCPQRPDLLPVRPLLSQTGGPELGEVGGGLRSPLPNARMRDRNPSQTLYLPQERAGALGTHKGGGRAASLKRVQGVRSRDRQPGPGSVTQTEGTGDPSAPHLAPDTRAALHPQSGSLCQFRAELDMVGERAWGPAPTYWVVVQGGRAALLGKSQCLWGTASRPQRLPHPFLSLET